jgi:hypothetical protein
MRSSYFANDFSYLTELRIAWRGAIDQKKKGGNSIAECRPLRLDFPSRRLTYRVDFANFSGLKIHSALRE